MVRRCTLHRQSSSRWWIAGSSIVSASDRRNCRAAYAAYEFHKVYHALNQFCAVDLSSLYIDITKDRMYCDARRFAAPTRHADGDALDLRCALPAARPDSRFYRRRSMGTIEAMTELNPSGNCFPKPQEQAAFDRIVQAKIEELLDLKRRLSVGEIESARRKS